MAGGVQGCREVGLDCFLEMRTQVVVTLYKQAKQNSGSAISLVVSQSPHRSSVKEAEERGSDPNRLSAMMTRRENG